MQKKRSVAMADKPTPPMIMFVDDEPDNLNLLQHFFSETPYALRFFTSGAHAWAAAQNELPDLLLLDVCMPGMDGYEVCRRFKADNRLSSVPVLFLSSLAATEEITKGFDLGAVDYITKPFRQAEVLARVRNHLALSLAYSRLTEQHIYLQELERQRDTFVHMLVHDLRSPLMSMLCHLRAVETSGATRLDEEDLSSLRTVIQCTRTLSRMVSTVVDLSRMEHAQLTLNRQRVPLEELFRAAREQVMDPLSVRRVTQQIAKGCPPVFCDQDLSTRILGNLLSNAIRYTPEATDIILGAEPTPDGKIRLWVKDHGPGIPTEDHARIFEKFVVTQHTKLAGSSSTGLGLAFCKLATEAQGGTIGLESEAGHGSLFWFTLPVA
jgi:two-component system sensor histidine kinase/response regulator